MQELKNQINDYLDQHTNNGEDWSVYVKYPNGLDKNAMYVDFDYYTLV